MNILELEFDQVDPSEDEYEGVAVIQRGDYRIVVYPPHHNNHPFDKGFWIYVDHVAVDELDVEHYDNLEPLMAQCVLNELLERYPVK